MDVQLDREVDTLALINGFPITSEDFRNRFEMSVYPGKDNRTYLEQTKLEFLYSMIAEKLLAQAAARSDTASTPSEEMVRTEMERIFMRDVLYRREVVPMAQVTENEVLHGFRISVYTYRVEAFYFEDKSKAVKFRALLDKNPDVGIYRLSGSLHINRDTLEIQYGESTAEIENAFFGHKAGFVSNPTLTIGGWVIFRVLSRQLNDRFTKGSTSDRLHLIKQILVSRKEEILGNKCLESIMRGVEVNVNYQIFRPLVSAIQRIFERQTPPSYNPLYRLSAADLLRLREEFAADADKALLSFKGGYLSLANIFQELPVSMFSAEDTTLPGITHALHASLRFISQNHFLVRKAEELGLRNSGEVQYNVSMILDSFRSFRMANVVTDSVKVSQKETDEYFATHKDEVLKAVRLKVKLYKVNDINQVINVLTDLDRERKLAIHTNDTNAVWVNAFNLGEIGAVLAELKTGQIYGPLEDQGTFRIYQLLDKRYSTAEETIKNSIQVAKEMLIEKHKREALDRYIATLAEDNNVEIFKTNVQDMKVTPLQTLMFRYIGFGGRLVAVPILYPRENWIRYFQKKAPLGL